MRNESEKKCKRNNTGGRKHNPRNQIHPSWKCHPVCPNLLAVHIFTIIISVSD